MEAFVARLSPLTTARYPEEELARYTELAGEAGPPRFTSPERVIEEASSRSPEAHLEGVFWASKATPVITVYMARKALGDYTQTDFVYFSKSTAQYLFTWHRGQNHSVGDWLIWLLVPLHFGTSWGMPFKLLWAALGLALPVLTVTGLLMFWNRKLSKWLRGAI